MARREFEVTVTRTGSQDECEQAYRKAIRFLLLCLPEQIGKFSQTSQSEMKLKEGQEGGCCADILKSFHRGTG